jgi:hypothetical protein
MHSGGITPHFWGLYLALAGVVALGVWLTRAKVVKRWGRGRFAIGGGVLAVLAVLALFGSGTTGEYMRASVSPTWASWPSDRARLEQAVDDALVVATSDAFIRYQCALNVSHPDAAALELTTVDFAEADIRPTLQARVATVDQLREFGISINPAPAADSLHLVMEYRDATNWGLLLLRHGFDRKIGEGPMGHRFVFAQNLMHWYLPELVALELYRSAADDAQRLEALRLFAMISAPEWVQRDLLAFEKAQPSPEVAQELAEVIAAANQRLDNPTLRNLPADFEYTFE